MSREIQAQEIARQMMRNTLMMGAAGRISAEEYIDKLQFLEKLILASFTCAMMDKMAGAPAPAGWGDDVRQTIYDQTKGRGQ